MAPVLTDSSRRGHHRIGEVKVVTLTTPPVPSQNRATLQTHDPMPSLDFDGDYGRSYRTSIRHSIPGYDTLHEIAIATVKALTKDVQRALVVGPGPGEELPSLLEACPKASFTVLEPSAQMLDFCKQHIASLENRHHCHWLQSGLMEACNAPLKGTRFDLVICHNVLHLFSSDQQNQMLHQLAALTDHGGTLMLSAYSEPEAAKMTECLLAVGGQRLQDRGLEVEQVNALLASRNQVVFSMDGSRLSHELQSAGMTDPLQLYQGLFAKLWITQKI